MKNFYGLLVKEKNELVVWESPFTVNSNRLYISNSQIRKFSLKEGISITGKSKEDKGRKRVFQIEKICGIDPAEFIYKKDFKSLTAISPTERFRIGETGDLSMRALELMTPFGKGSRGLIVSPPKAGKTTILLKIANSIKATSPNTKILVLLIDERPEEVTDFRRNCEAHVFASSSDNSLQTHVNLVKLIMAFAKNDLECGNDVVILLDSLTRLSRAFNIRESTSRKTMSGGIGADALMIPRQFFGLARNVEEGGSITILATILSDTGSQMDRVIFEEFKGTGNCEIILDSNLSENRIFPALNIKESGTRKDELLYSFDELDAINEIRRKIIRLGVMNGTAKFLEILKRYSTNEELISKVFS